MKEEASTERHRFHEKYFKVLLLLACIALMIELILIFFLRKPIFYGGLWLCAGVDVYILVNQWLKYFKEITSALLYSSVVMLPELSIRQTPLSAIDQLMIAQFVLIALINIILFSWMDYEKDLKDNHRSSALAGVLHQQTISIICTGVIPHPSSLFHRASLLARLMDSLRVVSH